MFAKYKNKTVKVLSKENGCCYLILNNNPTEEEKYLTFTITDILDTYRSIEEWKIDYDIIYDLEPENSYMWVNKCHLFFPSLIMETE